MIFIAIPYKHMVATGDNVFKPEIRYRARSVDNLVPLARKVGSKGPKPMIEMIFMMGVNQYILYHCIHLFLSRMLSTYEGFSGEELEFECFSL
jgi:hypothetical protein